MLFRSRGEGLGLFGGPCAVSRVLAGSALGGTVPGGRRASAVLAKRKMLRCFHLKFKLIRCNEAGARLRGLGGRCTRGRGAGGLGVSWAWPGAQCPDQDPEAGGCASKEGVRQLGERTETTELHTSLRVKVMFQSSCYFERESCSQMAKLERKFLKPEAWVIWQAQCLWNSHHRKMQSARS